MSDFKVNDRRLFTKDGEMQDKSSQEKVSSEKPNQGANDFEKSNNSQEKKAPQSNNESVQMPPANFVGLIVGLASSALISLGEVPEELVGKLPAEVDLPAAKHNIDLLALLEDKTKGNLTQEEDSLLKALLYDLRLKYIAMTK